MTAHEATARLDELATVLTGAIADASRPATDLRALAAWAQRRVDLHEQLAALERSATTAIADQGGLAEFERRDPGAAVRDRIANLRTLTGTLKDADRRRFALVVKCKDLVRSYLTAVNPPPSAYGRSGARAAQELPPSTRGSA